MEIGSTAWNLVGVLLGLYMVTSGLSTLGSATLDKATHKPTWLWILRIAGALMILFGIGMFLLIGSRFFV